MSVHAALIARLIACGLNGDGIAVHYENDLQSDIVSIRSNAQASSRHFRCIREAVGGDFVEFADQKLDREYRKYERDAAKISVRKSAVEWLRLHGKLDGAPILTTQSQEAWARSVEAFCGITNGEAFEWMRPDMMTLKRTFLTFPMNSQQECLMNVIWLSDLEARGVRFGFVGNEAFQERKK